MTGAHWAALLAAALGLSLLLCFSLSARPGTRAYRLARRVFWAALLLYVSGEMGGVGFGPANTLAVAALGLPGYAALMVLAAL